MVFKRKTIIIILISVAIVVGIIILIGFLGSRGGKSPRIIEPAGEGGKTVPIPITGEDGGEQGQKDSSLGTMTDDRQKIPYQPLFNEEMYYLGLDYPNLYAYDYDEGVVKIFNLKEDIYKELYKIIDFQKAYLSFDRSKMIVNIGRLNFLDLKTDKLYPLPGTTKNFVFTDKDLIVYINDDKNLSYLAYFRDGKTIKLKDLGVLNPELAFLPPDKILIYQRKENTPVFALNLKSPSSLSVFLEPAENYSLLINQDNKNLIFASNQSGSKIIDANTKESKFSFDWKTVSEKCTFGKFLVCAISSNFDFNNWYLLGENYDNQIIIFDTEKNEIVREINLTGKVDALYPQLVNSEIIFWNKWDLKIYSFQL